MDQSWRVDLVRGSWHRVGRNASQNIKAIHKLDGEGDSSFWILLHNARQFFVQEDLLGQGTHGNCNILAVFFENCSLYDGPSNMVVIREFCSGTQSLHQWCKLCELTISCNALPASSEHEK